MPTYTSQSAQNVPIAMRGSAVNVFNAEQPAVGATSASGSIAVGLTHGPGEQYGTPFSVDGVFSGAPGVFEVDVMVSQTQTPFSSFVTVSGGVISAVDATNQTFHADFPNVTAKFVLLLIRARANAVNLTATINA